MTDAPGEWFSTWASERQNPGAEGARWISNRATAFAFFVDSEALAGPEFGIARQNIVDLAQRLKDERQGRPVAIVWTKCDWTVPPPIRDSIMQTIKEAFPDSATFRVTCKPDSADSETKPENFLKLLNYLMTPLATKQPIALPPRIGTGESVLVAYRGNGDIV